MMVAKKSFIKRLKQSKKFSTCLSIALPLLLGVILVVLWSTGVLNKMMNVDEVIFPRPSRIFAILGDNFQSIMKNTVVTLEVVIIGLIIGSVIGYLLAVFAALFPKAGSGGLIVVSAFNAVPIVAIAPVFINLTSNFGELETRSLIAKSLVVIIACMATMSLNAYRGLTELKPFSEDLMKTYAVGKRKTLFKLRLPNSIPYVFTALRVSIPLSVISALVSEYFAEYVAGVGRMIRNNIQNGQYPTAWAYIVVACVIGFVIYGIMAIVNGILAKLHKA